MKTLDPVFGTRLFEWLADCQKLVDDFYKNSYMRPKLTISQSGRKYVRIVKEDSQDMVYAFVEIKTGDIYKPATWAAPAKHARGNIFDSAKGMARMNWHGPEYLK